MDEDWLRCRKLIGSGAGFVPRFQARLWQRDSALPWPGKLTPRMPLKYASTTRPARLNSSPATKPVRKTRQWIRLALPARLALPVQVVRAAPVARVGRVVLLVRKVQVVRAALAALAARVVPLVRMVQLVRAVQAGPSGSSGPSGPSGSSGPSGPSGPTGPSGAGSTHTGSVSVTTSTPICDQGNPYNTDYSCRSVQSAPIEAACPGGAVVVGGGENRTFVPTKYSPYSGTTFLSNRAFPQDTDSGPAANGLGWNLYVWHQACPPSTYGLNCWNYTVTAICVTGTTSGTLSKTKVDAPKGVAQRLPSRHRKGGALSKGAAAQPEKGK